MICLFEMQCYSSMFSAGRLSLDITTMVHLQWLADIISFILHYVQSEINTFSYRPEPTRRWKESSR